MPQSRPFLTPKRLPFVTFVIVICFRHPQVESLLSRTRCYLTAWHTDRLLSRPTDPGDGDAPFAHKRGAGIIDGAIDLAMDGVHFALDSAASLWSSITAQRHTRLEQQAELGAGIGAERGGEAPYSPISGGRAYYEAGGALAADW